MEYCENWDKIRKRYLEYWAMENHDRPLVSIRAPRAKQEKKPESRHTSLKERWMDTEYIIKSSNWEMRNTYYGGEAFPALNPNLGPDGLFRNQAGIRRGYQLVRSLPHG